MLVRAIILSALVGTVFAVPPAAAEGATSETCDASGLLVCAGLDVAGAVTCVGDGPSVTCDLTYGWIAASYSPLQLPGEAWREVAVTIAACVTDPCLATSTFDLGYCAWDAARTCPEEEMHTASYTFELELGQCATVEVELEGYVVASVPGEITPLAETLHVARAAAAAGAACYVDDGR